MKRKAYDSPTTQVVKLQHPMLMQVTSQTEVEASRTIYGDANSDTWE